MNNLSLTDNELSTLATLLQDSCDMSAMGIVEFTNRDEMSFYLDRADILQAVTSMIEEKE
tara:strand:+ start:238 stop:417 length:180 start_codon:yes stop_codon:yes gene_type:complete